MSKDDNHRRKFQNHRGRFQAQDNKLEESEPWHRIDPIPAHDGRTLLEKLNKKLSKADRACRKKAFLKCKAAIDEGEKNGGLGICKKSFFDDPLHKEVRVDLEVNAGLAFIKEDEKKK